MVCLYCISVFFPSGIGGIVDINENGDRDTDFTLIDVDPVSGNWRVGLDFFL